MAKIIKLAGQTVKSLWYAEISMLQVRAIAEYLIDCRSRPDTQVFGPDHLELLIRDETPAEIQTVSKRSDRPLLSTQNTCESSLNFTIGTPFPELLLRCAILHRERPGQLRIFTVERLVSYLVEI